MKQLQKAFAISMPFVLLMAVWHLGQMLMLSPAANTAFAYTMLDAGVEIGPDNEAVADPGQEVPYSHTIMNTGDTTDTFTVTVTSSAGFPVQSDQNSITLLSAETASLMITVTVPVTASGGIVDITTVQVQSGNDPNISATATNSTTVNVIAGIALTPVHRSSSANPGDTVNYNYTITNTGNAADTFTITGISSQGFSVSVISPMVSLSVGADTEITVEVTIPDSTASGIIDHTIITATSTNNPAVMASMTATTQVNVVAGVMITPDPNPERQVNPGKSATYSHVITNSGNANDTLTIHINSIFQTHSSILALPLASGGSATVLVTVTVPTSVASGSQDTMIVTVTSANDGTVTAQVSNVTIAGNHQLFLPSVLKPPVWEPVGNWVESDLSTSLDACNGRLFAGTRTGLRFLEGQTWTTVADVGGDIVTGVTFSDDCDELYVGLYNNGVWRGVRSNNFWNWDKLEGGQSVAQVRSLVLSDGRLFAAGEFGIRYWENDQWKTTNAPGSTAQPVIHMSVTDPVNNSGPVYAVQWFNGRVLQNSNPANQPQQWIEIGATASDNQMRAVVGDADTSRYHIGTTNGHYRLVGTQWQSVQPFGARALIIDGNNVYAGYDGGHGVFVAGSDGAFIPFNQGWSVIPPTIHQLVVYEGELYAATTSGIWVYSLNN